ncbi:YpdA family putative bacillithiol disulfide reductase [Hymenobacter busanensis]|uniref:YpdA family putative bacillithiol disulfide reductase n=1 Tax=Hymenobacter busanensis TaxID=2607656 RepID=A0A7L5A0H0_9BACT|nr:YpdA family putative bacillithiol disulfide reductase [Hymenobacter busanensis]KAA9331422.1 YpdA family putative bacillithiol disulfide reductase [Hymenobacter busanensis]QHJ08576.1 YpdA family putative bacillithiol disulfide reductase [Hymenobacter busanensis]
MVVPAVPPTRYDVAVIGAGPVGLACALEIQRRGLSVCVLDKGALVNSLVGYPTNMEFFSTPELLEIGGYPFPTSHYKPHREEALDYYQRVARSEKLPLRLYERVVGLGGELGNFTLTTSRGEVASRFVVVATGFFDVPNLLGVPGEDQPHVSHYYKEPYAHVGQRVIVIGAKNSSAKAALALTRSGAHVTLVVRGAALSESVKYWLRPDLLNRIAEGRITALYHTSVQAIGPDAIELLTPDGPQNLPADYVYALTGYRPDYSLLTALGVATATDAAATPLHDPATFETNRAGVYLAGTVCGGLNTSRWFIENGRHHAQVIAAHLAEQSH